MNRPLHQTSGPGDASGPPGRPGRWLLVGALLGLSLKMALALLAPLLAGLWLARLVAAHGALPFSGYTLVNAVNTTFFIAASSFLQSLYYVGGRALGRGEPAHYRAGMAAGVVLALLFGGAGAAISAGIGPLLGLLHMDPGLVAHARPLGLAAAAAMLPMPLLVVHRVHASLNERAGLVTLLSVAGALLTAVLASAWIRAAGAAPLHAALLAIWCTAGVNWLMLAIALLTCRASTALRLPPAPAPHLRPAVREVAAIGWPIGAVVLLDSLASLVSSLLVGYYWLPWVPLHMTVLLLVTVALIGPLGIAQAAVQHVSVTHARGQLKERNLVAAAALLLGLLFSLLVLAAFTLWPARIAALLLTPQALAAAAPLLAPVMTLGAVLLAQQALIVIAAALLRGIGQTRAPMRQAFVGYTLVASGGQLLLGPVLGYGLPGVWWGLLLGFGATAFAVLWRCREEFRQPAAPAAQPDLQCTTSSSPHQEIQS
jgi:MATE family multidrug resistance protein